MPPPARQSASAPGRQRWRFGEPCASYGIDWRQPMSKTLEDRLIRLEIPLPATLVPRVLSAASKRSPVARRRLRFTVTLAMMLLVGAFVASLYAAPRFADALASAPV